MLVGASPLHSHWLAYRPREKRGIQGGIIRTEPAVTPRLFPKDYANVLFRDAQHVGQGFPRPERPLRSRPNSRGIAANVGNRAGWGQHAMQLEGPAVCRLVFLAGLAQGRFPITLI